MFRHDPPVFSSLGGLSISSRLPRFISRTGSSTPTFVRIRLRRPFQQPHHRQRHNEILLCHQQQAKQDWPCPPPATRRENNHRQQQDGEWLGPSCFEHEEAARGKEEQRRRRSRNPPRRRAKLRMNAASQGRRKQMCVPEVAEQIARQNQQQAQWRIWISEEQPASGENAQAYKRANAARVVSRGREGDRAYGFRPLSNAWQASC